MRKLALVVDERELSTIKAALLLLQEQINALPEDLAEMIGAHGAPLTEAEIGALTRRHAVHETHFEASVQTFPAPPCSRSNGLPH